MNKPRNSLRINLSPEEKKKLMDEIKYYFEQERDEQIGIIASESLLDFFMNTLGVSIYNKGLDDAKLWFDKQLDNLESDFYTLYKSE